MHCNCATLCKEPTWVDSVTAAPRTNSQRISLVLTHQWGLIAPDNYLWPDQNDKNDSMPIIPRMEVLDPIRWIVCRLSFLSLAAAGTEGYSGYSCIPAFRPFRSSRFGFRERFAYSDYISYARHGATIEYESNHRVTPTLSHNSGLARRTSRRSGAGAILCHPSGGYGNARVPSHDQTGISQLYLQSAPSRPAGS